MQLPGASTATSTSLLSVPHDPDSIDLAKELQGLYPVPEAVRNDSDLIHIFDVTLWQLRSNTDGIEQTRQRLEELQQKEENTPDMMAGFELMDLCNVKVTLRLLVEEHERLEKLKAKLEEISQRIVQLAFENRYRHSV